MTPLIAFLAAVGICTLLALLAASVRPRIWPDSPRPDPRPRLIIEVKMQDLDDVDIKLGDLDDSYTATVNQRGGITAGRVTAVNRRDDP